MRRRPRKRARLASEGPRRANLFLLLGKRGARASPFSKLARIPHRLAKRRAAAAEIERAAKRRKPSAAAATATAGASGTEGDSKKVASADDKDVNGVEDADQSPQRRNYADDAADAEGLRWLHGVLVSAAAATAVAATEETQDELELELFLETALAAASSAAPGAPGAGLDRAGVLELLRRLDTKNHIMLHDSTIYII